MSSVNSVGGNSPVYQAPKTVQKEIPAEAAGRQTPTDKVELSGMSGLLKTLKSNDVRTDKVASIKAQIEAGTYEDDNKLDIAADRLLDDLQD